MASTVGKDVSEADLAYTAGFLDADGSVMATIETHKEAKYGFRVRVTVKITQRDIESLNWFVSTFQYGRIVQNRTTFDWKIQAIQDVKVFLKSIAPFAKNKSKQIDIALLILDKKIKNYKDLLYIAKLADSLSKFNVRSKNRRKNYAAMIQDSYSRND